MRWRTYVWLGICVVLGGCSVLGTPRPPQGSSATGTASPPAIATLYVAPSGSDSNPGTLAAPFRTIQHAVAVASPGTTIDVRAGTYHEEVVFDHGGSPGAPITLQNYPGETPILDGSLTIPSGSWTQLAGTSVWQATFTHLTATYQSVYGTVHEADAMSTCPDTYSGSQNRDATLYVDNIPDPNHWLKRLCIGTDPGISSPSMLPPGSFATNAPPPPLPSGQDYEGMTSTIWVNLADGSNPNNHLIRIGGLTNGIFFWGNNLSDITIRGLNIQFYNTAITGWMNSSHNITIDRNDLSLTWGGFTIGDQDACGTNWRVTNNHVYDTETDNIHVESSSSLIEGNLVEHGIAPWAVWGNGGITVMGHFDQVIGNTVRGMLQGQSGGTGITIDGYTAGNIGAYPLCSSTSNAPWAHDNLIENNSLSNNQYVGIAVFRTQSNTIVNNLLVNNRYDGVYVLNGSGSGSSDASTNNTFWYNTFYGNGEAAFNLGTYSTGTIQDNISFHNRFIVYGARAMGTQYTINHNLDGVNPLFVNAAAGNFHLRAGSPAIDAGVNVGITTDFDRKTRPQGQGFDIGAFEHPPDH